MSLRFLTLVLPILAFGCAADPSEPPDDHLEGQRLSEAENISLATDILLRLETRDGVSARGWSFDVDEMVSSEEAHLTISSWDCGARGRWVQLQAHGAALCHQRDGVETCAANLEIGGSNPEVAVGDIITVQLSEGPVELELVGRTETPFDWYETPDEPFEVNLALH